MDIKTSRKYLGIFTLTAGVLVIIYLKIFGTHGSKYEYVDWLYNLSSIILAIWFVLCVLCFLNMAGLFNVGKWLPGLSTLLFFVLIALASIIDFRHPLPDITNPLSFLLHVITAGWPAVILVDLILGPSDNKVKPQKE